MTNDVIAFSLAALKPTKLFGIDDFPATKDSGKVLIIIIYCYLIIIIIIIINCFVIYRQLFLTFIASNNLKHFLNSKLCIKAC